VKKYLGELGLHREWALGRGVSHTGPPNPCKHGKRTLNGDDDDDSSECVLIKKIYLIFPIWLQVNRCVAINLRRRIEDERQAVIT